MMNGLISTVTVNYNTVTVKCYGYCKINVTVTVTDTLIMVRTLNEVKLDLIYNLFLGRNFHLAYVRYLSTLLQYLLVNDTTEQSSMP